MKPTNDKEAITLILDGLIAAGCKPVNVWDGEELTPVTNTEEAVPVICNLDEAVLNLVLPADADRTGSHIYFVLGNEPEEVACDYGVSLSPYLDPIVNPWWEE